MEKAPRGYGPEKGYLFLRDAVVESEYTDFDITADDIFITNGIAPSLGLLLNSLGPKCVAIPELAYPQYPHAVKLAGVEKTISIRCGKEHNFTPQIPDEPCDLVILNSPMNPTGTALSVEDLQRWVRYAKECGAVILYDAAYCSFIHSELAPRSIYELEGALDVAIEMRSFSKSAGFSGLRLGYTVIPKRQRSFALYSAYVDTMTNGVAYPIQCGGKRALEVKEELLKESSIYMANAALIRKTLDSANLTCYGGVNCPYVWWEIPLEMDSFAFFELLLDELQIALIPGAAFGPAGDRYIRISGFAPTEIIIEALERITRRFA